MQHELLFVIGRQRPAVFEIKVISTTPQKISLAIVA
jgi:hypothetical protein